MPVCALFVISHLERVMTHVSSNQWSSVHYLLDKLYTSIDVHRLQKFAEIEKLRMHTNSFAYRSVCICGYQETRYMGKYVRKGWIMDIPHKLYIVCIHIVCDKGWLYAHTHLLMCVCDKDL